MEILLLFIKKNVIIVVAVVVDRRTVPEIFDELHEVLHGLDHLGDGEIVQHLLAVSTQLPGPPRTQDNSDILTKNY